jgi:hypothetical protein
MGSDVVGGAVVGSVGGFVGTQIGGVSSSILVNDNLKLSSDGGYDVGNKNGRNVEDKIIREGKNKNGIKIDKV